MKKQNTSKKHDKSEVASDHAKISRKEIDGKEIIDSSKPRLYYDLEDEFPNGLMTQDPIVEYGKKPPEEKE